jgi:hypothetical protein
MVDTKKAVAALAVAAEEGNLSLTLQADDGTPFKVVLDARIVSGVIGTILALGGRLKAAGDDKGMEAQVVMLTACRSAIADGRPVLLVQLEGSLWLPMTFPRSAIPALQNALTTLQQKATADPSAPLRN